MTSGTTPPPAGDKPDAQPAEDPKEKSTEAPPETPEKTDSKDQPEVVAASDNKTDVAQTVVMPAATEPEPAPIPPVSVKQSPQQTDVAATAAIPPVPPPPPAPPAGTTYSAPPPPPAKKLGLIVGVVLGAIVLIAVAVFSWMVYQNMATDRAHRVGKCVTQDGDRAKSVSCDDEDAYKIVKRLNDTTDERKCPSKESDLYFINDSDKYVLCLQKANA